MARQVIERLVDDLDGSDATETVLFALDGASYEIDLSRKNAAALRKALEPYLAAARRAGRSASTGRRKAPAARAASRRPRDYDLVQLREWAATNGVDVPSRGRIPQSVVAAYKGAGGR